jgi:hypothetical protein
MDERTRRAVTAGAILILVGIGLLILQFTKGFGEWIVLILIGGAFLVAYFLRRHYGLLIPGCILVGLGLGSIGENAITGVGDFTQIGLGIGFIAIYVIDRVYRNPQTHWWPLIPGGILIVTGIATLSPNLTQLWEKGWPLILILVGLILIGAAFGLFGPRQKSP